MIANIDNYALTGVPELCELYGDNQMVSSLKIGINLSVLSDVQVAIAALQSVLKFDSFDQSPKIIFNLSVLNQAIVELEVILEDGSFLKVDSVELIVTSNGEHTCYVLAFVDSFTNTSRREILLSRINN